MYSLKTSAQHVTKKVNGYLRRLCEVITKNGMSKNKQGEIHVCAFKEGYTRQNEPWKRG